MTNGSDKSHIDRIRIYADEIRQVTVALGTPDEYAAVALLNTLVSETRAVDDELQTKKVESSAGGPPDNKDIPEETAPEGKVVSSAVSREHALSKACASLIAAAKTLSQLPPQ